MPDSIFPLLVFGFGITGASILLTGVDNWRTPPFFTLTKYLTNNPR